MYSNGYCTRQVPLVNGIFHLVSCLDALPFTSMLISPRSSPSRSFTCCDIYTFLLQVSPRQRQHSPVYISHTLPTRAVVFKAVFICSL